MAKRLFMCSTGKRTQARVVETGLDNKSMIHVLSGIDEGDRVLLTPPLGGESGSFQGARGRSPDEIW